MVHNMLDMRFLSEEVNDQKAFTSFTTSFLAILVSQIGDKTFFLAMIWAMKYPKLIVFFGSFGALAVMTVLSTIFGKVLPELISKFFTDIIVTLLFFYFGFKMLYDAYTHEQAQGSENSQMKEVQQELKQMQEKMLEKIRKSDAESSNKNIDLNDKLAQNKISPKQKIQIPQRIILTQAFIMTFLAEWGDRSQIATIALAASFNAVMVTIGALLGHFLCTGAAVHLGQWISQRVKEKHVLYAGGIVFVISGIVTLITLL